MVRSQTSSVTPLSKNNIRRRLEWTKAARPDPSTVANLNGDVHLDLAFATIDEAGIPRLSVLWGRGDGTFESSYTDLELPEESSQSSVISGGIQQSSSSAIFKDCFGWSRASSWAASSPQVSSTNPRFQWFTCSGEGLFRCAHSASHQPVGAGILFG